MDRTMKHAFWLLSQFDIHRYLMANTAGRLSGAEKAERHRDICSKFIALAKRIEVDDVLKHHHELHRKIHDHSQALTNHLDREIGFPVGDKFPDYDRLAKRFSRRFVQLAEEITSPTQNTGGRS